MKILKEYIKKNNKWKVIYSTRISLTIEAERRKALIHCVIDCLLSAAK